MRLPVGAPRNLKTVAGSFRPGRPEFADALIERPRLVSRLEHRWSRRIVTVVAGPGFGKTSIVRSAIEQPREDRHDLWISCVPNDASAESLLSALGEALERPTCTSVEDVISAIWIRAPTQLSIVLDDLHEIPDDSGGAEVCRRLARELPGNGHLVILSRSAIPIPLARLRAQHQLERLTETDLLFDEQELAAFARRRGVEPSVVRSSGGWPALAELAAAADDELVYEFVWEEVLSSIGPEQVQQLARLAVVGGADESMADAIVPGAGRVRDLVAGIPLVDRRADGWVALHSLWAPILRPLLSQDTADEVRRAAATAHVQAGRHDMAVELFADAAAWDEIIEVIRSAELDPNRRFDGRAMGRWAAMLPQNRWTHPVCRFAVALDVASRLPTEACPMLIEAAAGFRAAGDVDAEVAVLNEHGFELWWANDVAGLIPLIARVSELAAAGSEAAIRLVRVGDAGVAHLGGDSEAVLRALDGIDELGVWAAGIAWLRHVAHRRRGDTVRAELALDAITVRSASPADPQLRLARLRLDWLEGRPADVLDGMRSVAAHYRPYNRYLHVETSLELAAKVAWLGERDEAEALLDEASPHLADSPGALVRVLWLITSAASAIDAGDETLARQLLDGEEVAIPGRVDNWYWRDRTATALPYVLIPEHRSFWDTSACSAAHRPGIALAAALVAMRSGDDSVLRSLEWPEPGVARVHLPSRWLRELVVGAALVGNPAPEELADLFSTPPAGADVRVLGPLSVRIGGVEIDNPDLRRGRVRELLQLLVAHRRIRRETVADALWPDLPDPRHNLRVTLNYLHRAMATGPVRGTANAYVRADRQMISLVESRVRCDLWDLDAHLATAERSERAGDPSAALRAYDLALPLWIGPPFDGIGHLDWVRDEQTRWRQRYAVAANRVGELHLAAGATREAIRSADHAIRANPDDERAFGIAARAHLAANDPAAARHVLDACLVMLAGLGVRPSELTCDLLAEVGVPLTTR